MTIDKVGISPKEVYTPQEAPEVSEAKEIKGKGMIDLGPGVISVTTVGGKVELPAPDLPKPGKFTEKDTQNMISNLSNIREDGLKNVYGLIQCVKDLGEKSGAERTTLLGSERKTGGEKTGDEKKSGETRGGDGGGTYVPEGVAFGDIEKLLVLLFKLFQTERKAAREERHVEYHLEQEEIKDQVKDLKKAASTALAMGITGAVMTLGFAALGGFKGGKATLRFKESVDLESDLATMRTFNATKARMADAGERIDEADANIAKAENSINEMNARINEVDTKINNVNTRLQKVNSDIEGLEAKSANLKEGEELPEEDAKRLNSLREEKQRLESEKSELEAEKARLKTQKENLEKDVEIYKKQKAQAEDDLRKAGDDFKKFMEGLKQKDVEKLSEADESKLAKMQKDFKTADHESQKLLRSADNWRLIGQVLGQLSQAIGQSGSEMEQAEATKHAGKAKLHEERAEDETDWMHNVMDLMRTARDTLKAIQQSLAETERAIATRI